VWRDYWGGRVFWDATKAALSGSTETVGPRSRPLDHPAGPGIRRQPLKGKQETLKFRESGSLGTLFPREPLSRN